MKILYVGDNRNRGNFGCRGTSTALSMLIRKKHEITGIISGKYTDLRNEYLFYYSFLPAWTYKFFGKHNTWKLVFENIIQRFGVRKSDFATLDLDKSIKNLKKCIPANPMLEELNLENYDFDAVVVNGEGSFIFRTPTWREPLVLSMLIYWSKLLGKKVFFMNAMFSNSPYTPQNVDFLNIVDKLLASCECVILREKESYEYAKRFLPHITPKIVPDALFSWFPYINDDYQILNYRYCIAHQAEDDKLYNSMDFSKPYILIAASSSAARKVSQAISAYTFLAKQAEKELGRRVFLIQTCDGDNFLNEVSNISNIPIIPMETPLLAAAKILSKAACFISGRYHPAVMASQGGTPCVFMQSNSHKTRSIQDLMNYDFIKEYNDIPDSKDVNDMIKLAKSYIEQGDILREKIKNRARELYGLSLNIVDYIR